MSIGFKKLPSNYLQGVGNAVLPSETSYKASSYSINKTIRLTKLLNKNFIINDNSTYQIGLGAANMDLFYS